jgi:hypothetical protein
VQTLFPLPEDKMQTTQAEWRYDFRGAPKQMNDEVMHVMIRTIRRLSKDHMLFAASNVHVYNVDLTRPITVGTKQASKTYAFKQRFVEFPIAADVKLYESAQSTTSDAIVVRDKSELSGRKARKQPWVPLEEWLLALPIPMYVDEGTNKDGVPRSIECQQIWWKKIGKCFPIMQLPEEIRSMIWLHTLGEDIYPHAAFDPQSATHKVTFGAGSLTPESYHNKPEDIPRGDATKRTLPNRNIFLMCKQVRHEALRAGWETGYKHFTHWRYVSNVLEASMTPFGFNWLNKIHINFTITEWFEFFGVSIDPVIHIYDTSKIEQLQALVPRGLKHLEFYFRDPYYHISGTWLPPPNPWGEYRSRFGPFDWFQDDDNLVAMEGNVCQKTVVDWLMTFAFEFIKDVPHVHLGNAVKTCTKEKWCNILRRTYRVPTAECSAHYDHAQELKAILGRPVYA